jgi:hypothetical protein
MKTTIGSNGKKKLIVVKLPSPIRNMGVVRKTFLECKYFLGIFESPYNGAHYHVQFIF